MDPSTSNGARSPWSYALSGKIMLSTIVVLFAVVLLILFLHLYVRWHVIRRASRQARRRRRLVFSGEGQALPSSAVNRGLDPSILASIPVLLLSFEGGQDDESVECAICLHEFEDGEKVRCLPKCIHQFHTECIDMWFYSHSTCPLCRAAVEAVKVTAASASGASPDVHAASLTDSSENDFLSSCQREEVAGSSSTDSGIGEVNIDIPPSRADISSGEEDQQNLGLESPEQHSLKSSSIWMVLIRWLLMRDPRIRGSSVTGSETDLELGEGVSLSS